MNLSKSFSVVLAAVVIPVFLFAMGGKPAPLEPLTGLEDKSSVEVVRLMGLGWNLGNTMEATGDWITGKNVRDYETAWGNPETTKEIIQAVKKAGFRSVRIPVGWSNLIDEKDFTINPQLMVRVQQIVDWVLEEDMIAVVNIHWDGGWWSKFPAEKKATMARFTRMWSQIAENFKDYPATLIFEDLNEEGYFDDIWKRWGGVPENKQKAFDLLNEINQTFVDLIRASGGMNAKRHLLIAGYNTDFDLTVSPEFKMPTDPENHCILSVHYYTPFGFTHLEKDESWAKARKTWGTKADLAELDQKTMLVKKRFIDNGVPIIVGEYGAFGKTKERSSLDLYMVTVAEKFYMAGMCPMLWDAGQELDREKLKFRNPKLIKGFQAILKKDRP